MAANTSNANPSFTRDGQLWAVAVTAANTSSQGGGTIGTDTFLLGTADATNGGLLSSITWMPAATATTTMTATVGRIYRSTQSSGSTTSSNTHLIGEVNLPAFSADSPSNAAPPVVWVPAAGPIRLAAGESILLQMYNAPAANTHWKVTADYGNY